MKHTLRKADDISRNIYFGHIVLCSASSTSFITVIVRNLTTETSGENIFTIRCYFMVTAISFSGGGGSGGGGGGVLFLSSTTDATVSLIFVTETPVCDLLAVSEGVVAEVRRVRSQSLAEAATL